MSTDNDPIIDNWYNQSHLLSRGRNICSDLVHKLNLPFKLRSIQINYKQLANRDNKHILHG